MKKRAANHRSLYLQILTDPHQIAKYQSAVLVEKIALPFRSSKSEGGENSAS